eukprot:1160142-Pelagomonas_calceolata.AAC.39
MDLSAPRIEGGGGGGGGGGGSKHKGGGFGASGACPRTHTEHTAVAALRCFLLPEALSAALLFLQGREPGELREPEQAFLSIEDQIDFMELTAQRVKDSESQLPAVLRQCMANKTSCTQQMKTRLGCCHPACPVDCRLTACSAA